MIGPRAAIFAAATTLGISAAVAQIVELPDGPGKTLVLDSCVDCHETSKITAARHTPDEWAAVVSRMVDHGAALSLEEQGKVVKYLSANLGTAAGSSAAPPPAASPPAAPAPAAPAQPSATRPAEPAAPSAPPAKKPDGAPR
jgi:pyruvate/2-oxoglutarate dehydrogenase complex dihydrolipoamide acyltransferase (E2) component